MDIEFNALTIASVDNTSDTLTLASVDNTSDTLTQASVDNTSDTLTQASVDNTSDTLTLASVDNTSDTLTQASVDNTSDTLTQASVDNTSDTLTLASVDNTSDTLTLASVDNTSDTLTLASVDNTSDTLTQASVDNTSDTLTLASVDNTSDTLTLASVDNTSDTLTLASVDKENQAPWEFEYSYGGEADLHLQYDSCKKNPGHKNFIPVDKFSIEDLPEDYRHKDVFDYIRAVSDLTVRVSVKYVSGWRPPTAHSSQKSYPGFSARGQRRVTAGTGCVNSVDTDTKERGPCKCKDCRNSSTPEMNFAIIKIITAAHMVFDDIEGEHTTFHLFFDRGGTPECCSGVVTLSGTYGVFSDALQDTCHIDHYTHDLDLARRLHQRVGQMAELRKTIFARKSEMCKFKVRLDVHDKQPLLFIVSHPHGCSKQVSLGRWTSSDMFNNRIVSLLYNTATCPGSSGARVCLLEEFTRPHMRGFQFSIYGAHCGVSDVQLDTNYCRFLGGFPKPKFVTPENNKGPWDNTLYCVEEEDQIQHYAACKKNPGNEKFFPVEKFSMDNLPPFYRRNIIMNLLKRVSDLTVRVTVKYVSENRPDTVPGTDIRYPWCSNRGSNLVRVGTGWIHHALVFENAECVCKECRDSPNRKTSRAYIEIWTSSHLVYDFLEAEQTTCHLFFDSGETPDVCKDVITLTDVKAFSYNINRFPEDTGNGTCRIQYFTHNLDLARSLDSVTKEFRVDLGWQLTAVDVQSTKYDNDGQNAKQDLPLYIVVSHPHGCAKQISIYCCGNPGNADTEESQCSNSSILCPGSIGAPVIDLSWKLLYPFCE